MSDFDAAPMAWLERQLNDAAESGITLSMPDIEDHYIQQSKNDDLKKSPELRRKFSHVIKLMMKPKFELVKRPTDILIPKQYGYKCLPGTESRSSPGVSVPFQMLKPTAFDSEMYINMLLVAQTLRSEIKQNRHSMSNQSTSSNTRAVSSCSNFDTFIDLLLTEDGNECSSDGQVDQGDEPLGKEQIISFSLTISSINPGKTHFNINLHISIVCLVHVPQ